MQTDRKENKMTQDVDAYGLLSAHRSAVMGFAILCVVFNHCTVDVFYPPLAFLKDVYLPADVFVFLSGIGVWESLSRYSTSAYIQHRLRKILPAWWIYVFVYAVLGRLQMGIRYTIPELLGFVTFTGYWMNMPWSGNWYAYAIMLFYFLAPVVFAMIRDSRKPAGTAVLLICIALVLSLPFLRREQLEAASRLPVFLLGMGFSAFLKGRRLSCRGLAVIGAAYLAGILGMFFAWRMPFQASRDIGVCWYPCFLAAPGACLLLAAAFEWLQSRWKGGCRLFHVLGSSAFEILLASDYIMLWAYERSDRGALSVLISAAGIFAGLVFHRVVLWIQKGVKPA